MENTKYKALEETILELQEELKPLFNEIDRLYEAFDKLEDEKIHSPLIRLLERLTRTARRHDLTNKVKIKTRRSQEEVVVGTNHNGLGIQQNYSSILEPLNNKYGGIMTEQHARDILFDDDANIELASIIKKSNQKIFLKTLKTLKKYGLVEAFGYFKEKNLNITTLDITDKLKIDLDISTTYMFDFSLILDERTIRTLCFRRNSENKGITNFEKEEELDGLKEIAEQKFYEDISLSQVKVLFYIAKNKDTLISKLDAKTTLLNSVVDKYKNETEELNKLLEPLLTLEKL